MITDINIHSSEDKNLHFLHKAEPLFYQEKYNLNNLKIFVLDLKSIAIIK